MAREQRIYYPGAIYHVITRGNNKEYIFSKTEEKSDYIDIIRRYKEKYGFNLYAYCIMDNHAHLLIEVGSFPLNKIMQGIQQVFTQRYNKRYERTGHVFEQRYKSKLCNNDQYLLQLIRYIHQNPLHANILEGLSYKWSSHKEYIGAIDLTDVEFPLKMFAKNKKDAISLYRDFVNVICEDNLDVLKHEKEYENKDEIEYEKEYENKDIESKLEKENCLVVEKRKLYMSKDIVDAIIKVSGCRLEEIYGVAKNRQISDLRKTIIMMLKNHTNLNNGQIANIMGVGLSTVSNIINNRFKESEYFIEIKAQAEAELLNVKCEA